MKKTVWMYVTNDEFELPIAVADTQTELAKITGKNRSNISQRIKYCKQVHKPCRFIKQVVEYKEGEY